MKNTHEGGCLCGALRYAFDGPLRDIAHCHCSLCRRSTGGTLVTWITVPKASFRWLSGTPRSVLAPASCTRCFCGDCGAHLALFTTHSPESVDVTVASLDEAGQARPDRHIWTGSRLPWLHLDPQLPEEQEEAL